jgi:hypothetical protein
MRAAEEAEKEEERAAEEQAVEEEAEEEGPLEIPCDLSELRDVHLIGLPPSEQKECICHTDNVQCMERERVCVCVLLTGETSRRSVLYYWRIQRSTCVLFVPVSVLHPLLLSLTCCRPRCCGRW